MKLSLFQLLATQALLGVLLLAPPYIPFANADTGGGDSDDEESDDGDGGGDGSGCSDDLVEITPVNAGCDYQDFERPFHLEEIHYSEDDGEGYVEYHVYQHFKAELDEEYLGVIWLQYEDEEGEGEPNSCFANKNVQAKHKITPDTFRSRCGPNGKAKGNIYIHDNDIDASVIAEDRVPRMCWSNTPEAFTYSNKCLYTFEIDCDRGAKEGCGHHEEDDEDVVEKDCEQVVLLTPMQFEDEEEEGELIDYCDGMQPSDDKTSPVITITEALDDEVRFTVSHQFTKSSLSSSPSDPAMIDWMAMYTEPATCIFTDSSDMNMAPGENMEYLSDNLDLTEFSAGCTANRDGDMTAKVTIYIQPDDANEPSNILPINQITMDRSDIPLMCFAPAEQGVTKPTCAFQYELNCDKACGSSSPPEDDEPEDPHNDDPHDDEVDEEPSGQTRCTGHSAVNRPDVEVEQDDGGDGDEEEKSTEDDEDEDAPRVWSRGGGTTTTKVAHRGGRRELFNRRREVEETRKETRQFKWLLEQCAAGSRSNEQREALRSCVRWGVGLEHDTMVVHRTEDGLEEYAVNAGSVIRDMALYGRVHGLDRKTHSIAVSMYHRGVTYSGRRCSGIKELNYKALLRSASQDRQELTFDAAYCQINTIDNTVIDIVAANPNVEKVSQDIGPVTSPRTGMSSELGMYQKTSGKFWKCSACGTCDLKDFTGSYQVSVSLPSDPEGWIAKDESLLLDKNTCAPMESSPDNLLHEAWMKGIEEGKFDSDSSPDDIKRDQWVTAHTNFANMIQWIEPVISATFDSADGHSVCDGGFFTEGSYRTMSSGWGVHGTTDVRTFGDFGTGRYSFQGFEWLFPEMEDKLPQAYKNGLLSCIDEGMGSDIRVQSAVDEKSLGANETLPGMDVGDGIEIRVFDNFPSEHLPTIYRLIAFVAEASRLHTAEHFVYGDEDWVTAMQAVSNEGWNAILPKAYVSSLADALDLPELITATGENTQAFNVFTKLYHALWEAHVDGMWTNLIVDDLPESIPFIRNPNRESWEIGAMNAGVSPSMLLDIMNIDHHAAANRTDAPIVLTNIALKSEDADCGEDLEDLVFLAETYGMVDRINYLPNGSVESFVLTSEEHWDAGFFESPTCKADLEL